MRGQQSWRARRLLHLGPCASPFAYRASCLIRGRAGLTESRFCRDFSQSKMYADAIEVEFSRELGTKSD